MTNKHTLLLDENFGDLSTSFCQSLFASLPLNFALKLLLFIGGNYLYKLSTDSGICA